MDRWIGEIFYSELLHCYLEVKKETNCCYDCAYLNTPYCTHSISIDSKRIKESGGCSRSSRESFDDLGVIFKKIDVSSEFGGFCLEVRSIGLEKEEEEVLIELMRKAIEKRGN